MPVIRYIRIAFLFPLLLLAACSMTGSYNGEAHRQLVMLQALHMQFIDDATMSDTRDAILDERDYRVQYRAARLFAENLGDPLRLNNLQSLHNIWQAQSDRFQQQQRPFNSAQARLFSRQASAAYQQAIHGECLRPHSVCQ